MQMHLSRSRNSPRRGPALTLSVLIAALTALVAISPGAAAPDGDPIVVQPTQALGILLSSHVAMSAPDERSTVLQHVGARRPITGERTVLPVVGFGLGADGLGWLHVLLPGRPNGHKGWIKRRSTRVTLTSWHIIVDTSERRVTVYQQAHPVRFFMAVVGKAATPTPRGEFFVEEAVQMRPGEVGAPFALALSARSNILRQFGGGPGQIALHGRTNVGGVLGSAVSHGCVRLASAAIRWLAYHIGPGVPVTIER
jgi:lipoprotein-anchoring transpeptidase ErfK/SrfK